MADKPRLGVHGAWYLKPLLQGLDHPDSLFALSPDLPAAVALKFGEHPEGFRGAFVSPIDYARRGGQYCIIPHIGVSSALDNNTIQLFVQQDRRSISTVAVDIRVTSEIILAKIILTERFPNLPSDPATLQFIPMLPDVSAMLKKADAALVVNDLAHAVKKSDLFSLDLAAEWKEMTDLPYVHGFWVGREGHLSPEEARALSSARDRGTSDLGAISALAASESGLPPEICLKYLESFSYELGPDQQSSLSEFFRYSFYHGIIRDVPEINFFPFETPPPPSALVN